jgi:hypothetical protein
MLCKYVRSIHTSKWHVTCTLEFKGMLWNSLVIWYFLLSPSFTLSTEKWQSCEYVEKSSNIYEVKVVYFETNDMLDWQPHFAKLKFNNHNLFSVCLVFFILIVCLTLLFIWSTCYRVIFYQLLPNYPYFIAATFAKCWLSKLWMWTR